MSAIVTALQSLSQLILTCDIKRLAKNEKRFLTQLGDILTPESDHLAYREALQNMRSPIAIPWLGAYTSTLPASGTLLKTNTVLPLGRSGHYRRPFT